MDNRRNREHDKMKSPCINVCQLKNKTTHMECIGCGRTQEEIQMWTKMTDEQRDKIMKRLSPKEYGGPQGKEPTRFGTWELNGREIDF